METGSALDERLIWFFGFSQSREFHGDIRILPGSMISNG